MSSSSSGRKRQQPVRIAQDSSSGEDSDSASQEGEPGEDNSIPEYEVAEIDFEGQSICESDYNCIKRFLQEILPSGSLAEGQIVEEIIAQEGIGSVITSGSQDDQGEGQEAGQEEEPTENTLGVTTVLMLDRIKNSKLCQQIKDFFRNQSEKFGMGTDMAETLQGQVGWLVHERFPEIPEEIAPHLLGSLKTELDQLLGKSTHRLHLVGITRAYLLTGPSNKEKNKKSKKKKKLSQEAVKAEQLKCVYPEMQHALEKSLFTFKWPLVALSDDELKLFCVCYVLDYEGLKSILASLS